MSLYQRLWAAISTIILLSFIGSFLLSNLSSRHYFEQQLSNKNADTAITLSQLLSNPQLDTLSRELLLNAQFDTGHYAFIRLHNPDGKLLLERLQADTTAPFPWLAQLFPIEPANGIAQISNGWQQIGTLTIASQTQLAYQALYNSSLSLLGYFTLAAILCSLAGVVLIRQINRPLSGLVEQAHALAQRRFITRDTPQLAEFEQITYAMNSLSLHIQRMLSEESARLENWQTRLQYDPLTSLMKRQPCLAHFQALLDRNDATAAGTIVLIQLQNLAQLNLQQGRKQVDQLLKKLGHTLNTESRNFPERLAARLNGSDLLLVVPGYYQSQQLGQVVYQALLTTANRHVFSTPAAQKPTVSHNSKVILHCVATSFRSSDTPSTLLTTLNHCLQLQPASNSSFTLQSIAPDTCQQQQPWLRRLDDALNNQGILLQYYPVVNQQGQLSHFDACARLKSDSGPALSASVFLASLKEAGWCYRLDRAVLTEALQQLSHSSRPLAIHLSATVLRDAARMQQLLSLLHQQPDNSPGLQLEFSSSEALLYMEGLKTFCRLVQPLGCKVGLKHIGRHPYSLNLLADSGLDYIGIDGSLIQQLETEPRVGQVIMGICSALHTLGLTVQAEQVSQNAQWQQLQQLGIDSATGPFFSNPTADQKSA
ncbi:MAG: EAL domain-containing protein [Marinobacterium sp.]|nr:EAL domain-containing protein [Marinobacterium sp.]